MSEPDRGTPSRVRPASSPGSPWAFRIGTLLGVPIRVHVTFFLLLVWYGSLSTEAGEGFLEGIIFLLLVFFCVVLHELGHATMARRFGVRTSEIVLYPIGGVARLNRIPGGKAELLIAIAGPAVNVVLATILFGVLTTLGVPLPGGGESPATAEWILTKLLWTNVALFVFNLIPAFPMDGGRILRAALSLGLGQRRATTIAARIGQGMAILFGVFAFWPPPVKPVLLLIAFFVFMGAGQENAYQRGRAAVKGLTARSAMVTRFETLAPQDSLGRAADLLLATHQQDFPVIDAWQRVAGVLSRADLLRALASGGRDGAVLEVMDREIVAVDPNTPLEAVLNLLQSSPVRPIMVISEKGLDGMITLDNFGELLAVSRSLGKRAVDSET